MSAAKREEGAAGRLEIEEEERVAALRRIYEITMPKGWHDRIRQEFGAELVICNIPGEPIWYPPSADAYLPGVILARCPQDVLRFLMVHEPTHQEPANGGR